MHILNFENYCVKVRHTDNHASAALELDNHYHRALYNGRSPHALLVNDDICTAIDDVRFSVTCATSGRSLSRY